MFRLVFSFVIFFNYALAIVPTIDQHQLSDDITTMTTYASTIGAYLQKISQAVTVAEQINKLQGLQQLEAAGNALCDLCKPIDIQKLQIYINNINGDLCSQFSFALGNITGIAKSIQSINDVINAFATNPKEAGLALQRASMQTQVASQNTLAQIQLLMTQQTQKQLASEKLAKQNNDAIYSGFHNNKL
jgi:hypothetical protein